MKNLFSHLSIAHIFWKEHLTAGSVVIDATCGNGHDSAYIASLLFSTPPYGTLHCIDIQQVAIESTKKQLLPYIEKGVSSLFFHHQSHENLPETNPVDLIIYNLGYLPGSDKKITTIIDSTLTSVKKALSILKRGGILSITLYPGHIEGNIEYAALHAWISTLDHRCWTIERPNKPTSPSLLLIEK